jgi:hypothetical protein
MKERLKEIIANKDKLIAEKIGKEKHADGVIGSPVFITTKAVGGDELRVKIVVNTTNLMDSYDDVHLPGMWDKSLKENRDVKHLQEHLRAFDKVIADGDDLKAYTQMFEWMELGVDYQGKTQALVFESTIKPKRNPFMYDQYRNGYVKNHSVGMIYVKVLLAVNDEDYAAEHEAWEKYYPLVANKELADERGYFFVVKEAKLVEGSAVLWGANSVTPTLEITEPQKSTLDEPPAGTHPEPQKDTLKEFYYQLIKN